MSITFQVIWSNIHNIVESRFFFVLGLKFQFISGWCLLVTEDMITTLWVLSHWNITPQTQLYDILPSHIILATSLCVELPFIILQNTYYIISEIMISQTCAFVLKSSHINMSEFNKSRTFLDYSMLLCD